VLTGLADRPRARPVAQVDLEKGTPPAWLLFDPDAPQQLFAALAPEQPSPLWVPVGATATALAAALLPYTQTAVPSRLQLPQTVRGFVGHSESLGRSWNDLSRELATHPAVFPQGWGSAYDDDPWPRPLSAELPPKTLALLAQGFAGQSADLPRTLTFATRWSRSLVSLEDHDGAIVLAIAHAPGPPVDALWVQQDLPFADAEALLAQLHAPASAVKPERVTTLLGLAAVWYGDLRLIETLRRLSEPAAGDWALRAASIAIAARHGYSLLLHELCANETDDALRAELQARTALLVGDDLSEVKA
jgi:hypothetical protein